MTGSAAPAADALRRRLRDDPAAARAVDTLRRAAYGRDAADAPVVRLPVAVRVTLSIAADALPAPLVALMTEEARLVEEGRALLERDAAWAEGHDEDDDDDGPSGSDGAPAPTEDPDRA
ncbi:hypothetical protein C5B94_16295, partial [Clavibacter michiganensis]